MCKDLIVGEDSLFVQLPYEKRIVKDIILLILEAKIGVRVILNALIQKRTHRLCKDKWRIC